MCLQHYSYTYLHWDIHTLNTVHFILNRWINITHTHKCTHAVKCFQRGRCITPPCDDGAVTRPQQHGQTKTSATAEFTQHSNGGAVFSYKADAKIHYIYIFFLYMCGNIFIFITKLTTDTDDLIRSWKRVLVLGVRDQCLLRAYRPSSSLRSVCLLCFPGGCTGCGNHAGWSPRRGGQSGQPRPSVCFPTCRTFIKWCVFTLFSFELLTLDLRSTFDHLK